MKLASFLCCLLLMAFNEIQRVHSKEIEIADKVQIPAQISAPESPKKVAFAKENQGRLVLKRIKLKSRVRVPKWPKSQKVIKLKSAPKPRYWRPKLKTVGQSAAGIAAGVAFQQAFQHFYDRLPYVYTPKAQPPTATNEDSEAEEPQPAVMHYPQLAPFMIPPAYATNPPYLPQYQAAYHSMQGFPSPVYRQNLNFEKPTEDEEKYSAKEGAEEEKSQE